MEAFMFKNKTANYNEIQGSNLREIRKKFSKENLTCTYTVSLTVVRKSPKAFGLVAISSQIDSQKST